VARAAVVNSGTVWLTGSLSAAGNAVDHPPPGMAIPLEMAGTSLSSFGPFMPGADQPFLPLLARGQVLLGATSARIRRLGPGATLVFGSRRLYVAGVVPDADIGAHEVFASAKTASRFGLRTHTYLLLSPAGGASLSRLSARIHRVVPSDLPVQIRLPGQATYLRRADSVLPPVMEKLRFGEFAANPAPRPGGWLSIDPAWVARHILTAWVPILGQVACNRAVIPQLRGALGDLAREGLASLIHLGDYGGCYAPRLVPGLPGQVVSHHAWGSAIDVNVSVNLLGSPPHQDPRVVSAFEHWGFTWGGRWLVPDGMHFEIIRQVTAG